jgi:hypothetical protein
MNEEAIFCAALEIEDPAARKAYLDQACAGEAALRRQVEALLEAHARSGEFLDVPAAVQMAPAAPAEAAAPDLSFLRPSTRPGSLGRLGHYEVLEVLGQGGFGIVFKAFDEILHRPVAIKVLLPQLAVTSPARKRFLREGRAAASIRHENVVDIHAIEEQPLPFLVMELVVGETLQQRLDRTGPLDTIQILRIGVQIAHGLAAAHALGLVHRDINPANILLESGDRVKITDFGLARAADDASITQSGVIAGTPLYMSPEQALGGAIDHRTDLFSLGSVLYVMCSGRPPFRAGNALAVLQRVAQNTPRPIREIIPEVPSWLCAVIARLHAKKPEDRFGSAQEVADLLERSLAEMARGRAPVSAAAPVQTVQLPPHRAAPQRRWLVAAVLLLALAGLGAAEATGVTQVRGTVIRLFSPEGTLVVEVDDPEVSISLDGKEIVIAGAGTREIRVKPGMHVLLARRDGMVVGQQLVAIERRGKQVVRISREAAPPAARSPERRAAEYVLSIGGWVWVNGEDGEIKAIADLPREPFRLTSIDLSGNAEVSDAGLAAFQGCRSLTSIDLNETPVGDAGMIYFKECRNLEELYLHSTHTSDAGMAAFQDCKHLTHIDLSHTQVGDVGLAYLKRCRHLVQLYAERTDVADESLALFKDCTRLTALDLGSTGVSDAGLANFKDCKDLDLVRLYDTKVTDAGLAWLKDCKNLTRLYASSTQVSDKGLAQLHDRKKLTEVHLHRTKVTAAGIDALKKALPRCKIGWDGGEIDPGAGVPGK